MVVVGVVSRSLCTSALSQNISKFRVLCNAPSFTRRCTTSTVHGFSLRLNGSTRISRA